MIIIGTNLISCKAKQTKYESDYIELISKELGGEREVSVTNGRIDILTDEIAYEVEWARKWKHSIGQAIWYGLQSDRTPGIILILQDKSDYKYVLQLESALLHSELNKEIVIRIYPNDFQ